MRPIDLQLADCVSTDYVRRHFYEVTKLNKPVIITNHNKMVSVLLPYQEILQMYRELDKIRMSEEKGGTYR